VLTLETEAHAGHIDAGPVGLIPPGEGRLIVAGGKRFAVFRTRKGDVYAAQPECPHKGGPLADGLVGGQTVVCPLHEYRFNLATGQPIGNNCPSLKTFRVFVNERGRLMLDLSADG
jgi:nitrite reductase (NADH) small subunit